MSSLGVPQSFQTASEMCKFVTMVIFSCSALHAAVYVQLIINGQRFSETETAYYVNLANANLLNSFFTFSWILTFGYRTVQPPCHGPLLRPKTQCLRKIFSPFFRRWTPPATYLVSYLYCLSLPLTLWVLTLASRVSLHELYTVNLL